MRNEYKQEMDRQQPRREALERLYEMTGGSAVKQKKWLGFRAVAAIAACAALIITAAAQAPTIWNTIKDRLGLFAPYARTIEGAECTDQGVRIRVLGALADDLEARFYLSVQDVEADRLDEHLTLEGRLTAGEGTKKDESEPQGAVRGPGLPFTSSFELVSYDPETKTALLSATIYFEDSFRIAPEAKLSVTGMRTTQGNMQASLPCAGVTAATLESLPMSETDTVIFDPDSVVNAAYGNEVLPKETVVLAPGQTPMAVDGTGDVWVSSMGFAGDGCFHIRLEFAREVEAGPFLPTDKYGTGESCFFFSLRDVDGKSSEELCTVREILVDGGMDITFPLVTVEDLPALQGLRARFYGPYTRSGAELVGDWQVEFPLEYHPSVTLDWTGELSGRQVSKVTVSPLSVTMHSDDAGGLSAVNLYAVRKDGSTVAAKPDNGRYSNLGGEEGWSGFSTWKFVEPVEVGDIVSLTLDGGTIPMN